MHGTYKKKKRLFPRQARNQPVPEIYARGCLFTCEMVQNPEGVTRADPWLLFPHLIRSSGRASEDTDNSDTEYSEDTEYAEDTGRTWVHQISKGLLPGVVFFLCFLWRGDLVSYLPDRLPIHFSAHNFQSLIIRATDLSWSLAVHEVVKGPQRAGAPRLFLLRDPV